MNRLLLSGATLLLSILCAHGAALAQPSEPRFQLEFEAGPVWQSRNDVQVPNDDSGTRFSLVDLAGSGPSVAGRLYFTWNLRERHSLRFLAAPLEITGTGVPTETVSFAGATFEPGVPTDATYRFNSWRVGYRYRFLHGEHWTLRAGFTAKIRDAEIRLEQPGAEAEKTDLGFVPLAHFSGEYRFAEHWRFLFELDGLAGGPGRAEDLSLKLGYQISPRWLVSGGYRTVEGGADVDEVYNFAWLHYGVVSATISF